MRKRASDSMHDPVIAEVCDMDRLSFSDGLGIAGIILTIVLVVLDKSGKLKGGWLYGLLVVAGVLTLFIAINNSWVMGAPPIWRLWRGCLMFCVVAFAISGVSVWISTESSAPLSDKPAQRARPENTPPLPTQLQGGPDPTQEKPENKSINPLLRPKEESSKSAKSDIALRFIYPNRPALVIVNQSHSDAREMKWTLLLCKMDLPHRNDPLPIPVTVYDFIRAHREGGHSKSVR